MDNDNKWPDDDFGLCKLDLDVTPPPKEFENIVKLVNDAAISASEIQLPFSSVVPASMERWQKDSRAGITVPVGQFGAREIQPLVLDEKLLSSALIIGKTGSGKSTLLHVLILGLSFAYSPDELEFYLLDFKQVEFKDYAINRLPHARVVAVKSEREFGLSVIRGIDRELQRRKDIFGNLTSLSDFRSKTGQNIPRILLIADEFQELFSYDDALASESGLIIDRLVRQGRAFGINILLASQTLAGSYTISNPTKNQMPIRIALQCSENDSRLVLGEENDRARLLNRPGEAIYNDLNGRLEGNNRFQVFWLGDEDREAYLKVIREMADESLSFADRTPIIFDGDLPSRLENNKELINFIENPTWPVFVQGYKVRAWLGEPIEIKPHASVTFRRQSRSNLVVIGQDDYEKDAIGILMSAIISLAAQQDSQSATFSIINFTDVDTPWHNLPLSLIESLPHKVQVVKRRESVKLIEEIAMEIESRYKQPDVSFPSRYFVIIGLHRAYDLRRGDNNRFSSSYSDEN